MIEMGMFVITFFIGVLVGAISVCVLLIPGYAQQVKKNKEIEKSLDELIRKLQMKILEAKDEQANQEETH